MALIEFENVSFSYPKGERPVFTDLSLQIEAGEFVCVLGANGSGKSTMARHINALLQPTQGVVRVAGIDTRDKKNVRSIRQKAGMVFQNPENQAVASVVKDDVAFGPENLGLEPQLIRERVAAALKTVHMAEHADDDIFNLSGGEKQRVAIAGVLAMEPEILIMDEPSAMLDERSHRGIMRVAHELNEQGITIVMITHCMDDAVGADRIIVMEKGEIFLQGTPREVFCAENAAELRRINLGLPHVTELALRLQENGVAISELPLTQEELVRAIVDASNK